MTAAMARGQSGAASSAALIDNHRGMSAFSLHPSTQESPFLAQPFDK
jgi:hypothetical protein